MIPYEGVLNKKTTPRHPLLLEHMGSFGTTGTGGSQWRDLGCKAKFSYTGCGKESQRPAGGGEGVPSGLNLKDEHTFPHEEEHSSSIDTQLVELRQR